MTSSFYSNALNQFELRKSLAIGYALTGLFLFVVIGLEFQYQYLHNPAVHIFFQLKGIFLF